MIDKSYFEEIKLSRALARAIEEAMNDQHTVIPSSVRHAFYDLRELYRKQIEEQNQ